jgi:hypothetical protein
VSNTPPINHFPPVIVRSYRSSDTASAGQVLTYEVVASDPEGSALTFSWQASTGSLGAASNTANSSRLLWTAPGCVEADSTPTVTATVTNAFGLSDSVSFSVAVSETCPGLIIKVALGGGGGLLPHAGAQAGRHPLGLGQQRERAVGGWLDHPAHQALYDALRQERQLREEVQRFKKEENSVDHAYATLLANGEVKKTPFRREKFWRSKNEDMDIAVEVFSGPGKAAVLVHLSNTYYGDSGEPWKFDGAYVTRDYTSFTSRPFAIRLERSTLQPGQSGKIAVVVDKSAFETKTGDMTDLALQIFRGDGLLQVAVTMEASLIRK